MSPNRPLTKKDRVRNRITAVIAMVLVWNLLWGEFTLANVITGTVVSLLILVFLPLPAVTFGGRLRPIGLLRFGVRFAFDLLVASVQVAWLAFRPGKQPVSAIIAVPLRVKSDLNMTLVGEAVSLVPGSLIVEADRHTGTLYIHMIGVRDREHLERLRQGVLDLEARLARAIGSNKELRKCELAPDAYREEVST